MRKSYHSKIIFLLLFSLLGPYGFAQAQNERSTYIWFDKVVGSMSLKLANGVEYIEEHRTINENSQFLLSRAFLPGSIKYDGQTYFNVPMKFNVYEDLLIVKLRENLDMAIFQLLNEKVSGFSLNGHQFVQLHNKDGSGPEVNGYYELLINRPKLKLLKKHRKRRDQILDEDFVYYEFYHLDPDYLISTRGKYHMINSKRDFFKIFPEKKKEIRSYYRTYRSILKSDPDRFMKDLFREIELTLSEEEKALGR